MDNVTVNSIGIVHRDYTSLEDLDATEGDLFIIMPDTDANRKLQAELMSKSLERSQDDR